MSGTNPNSVSGAANQPPTTKPRFPWQGHSDPWHAIGEYIEAEIAKVRAEFSHPNYPNTITQTPGATIQSAAPQTMPSPSPEPPVKPATEA